MDYTANGKSIQGGSRTAQLPAKASIVA